jgi:GT2 family glycosyltransferase
MGSPPEPAGPPGRADGGRRPRASVIIPSWNGARFLPACLDALRVQTLPDIEVLLVDNGSTDDTAAVVARYPAVRVLRLTTNRGFAAAVNAGIRAARGEVIALLNNDTAADAGWLAALVAALAAAPEAGMATSKVLLFDRRDVLHTTGDTLDLAGSPGNRGVWEVDRGQWDAQRDVFGASGAAAAYRRALLEDVGLFEESFGSYLEDVDLAWRARLAGWGCVYVPEAVVYHHLSATGGGAVASYLVARNRTWLIARNYPTRLLLKHGRRVLGAQLGALRAALGSWRGAEARATLRGLLVGWLTWPRMLPARRRIQARRTLSDRQLERLMCAR